MLCVKIAKSTDTGSTIASYKLNKATLISTRKAVFRVEIVKK